MQERSLLAFCLEHHAHSQGHCTAHLKLCEKGRLPPKERKKKQKDTRHLLEVMQSPALAMAMASRVTCGQKESLPWQLVSSLMQYDISSQNVFSDQLVSSLLFCFCFF